MPLRNPLQGAEGLLAAGDAQVDGDRHDGGDEGQGPADPVDPVGVGDAEEAGPPTSAPTAPSTMVHRIEMFCSPRMTRRARAPSTAPAMIIPMNDSMVSSSEKVR